MLESLQRGTEGVSVNFSTELRSGNLNILDKNNGVVVNNFDDFKLLFKDVILNIIPINFNAGVSSQKIMELFLRLAKEKKMKPSELSGSIDNDPLAELLIDGKFATGKEERFKQFRNILILTKDMNNFKGVTVGTHHYSSAGASIVQELAYSLATAVEYLNQLKEEITVEEALSSIGFSFSIGTSYFMEIAKLRAFRFLWSKIVEQYSDNKDLALAMIHTKTAAWNMTIFDPNVNMLRTTTEAMSAVIGGCNSLSVTPYDDLYQEADHFSLRIARNTQLILKEEVNLDKLVDPSGGSYYIENITSSLISEAWNLFLDIQEKGGMLQAIKSGFIQDEISKIGIEKEQKIAQARKNIVGTNYVPNDKEHSSKVEVTSKIEQKLDIISDLIIGKDDFTVTPLPQTRGSEKFEKLRFKTEKFEKRTNSRVKVFLAKFGIPAELRVAFARNFI